MPCSPEPDGASESQATGAFLFVRAGDSVELKAFDPPRGASFSIDRCIPPGDEGLICTASFNDGEMWFEREELARRVCKSLRAR